MATIPCKVSPAMLTLLVMSVLVYFAAAVNKTNQPSNNMVRKQFGTSVKIGVKIPWKVNENDTDRFTHYTADSYSINLIV